MLTKSNDNARGIAHIFGNVLIYSFFPLFSMFAVTSGNIMTAIFYSQVVGFASTAVFAKRKPVKVVKADIMKAPILLVVMSFASIMVGVFFLYSLKKTSGLTATIALEIWPLFLLLFSIAFIQKDWNKLTPFQSIMIVVASCGIIILAVLENSNSTIKTESLFSIGVFLAVLASIASGATGVQTQLFYHYEKEPSFRGASYTIMIVRSVMIIPTLIVAVVLGEDLLNTTSVLWGTLIGLTIYGVAPVLAISGLRHSKNLANILIWFLTPVIAAIWITVFLGERISDMHVIAFMPILLANIFVNVRQVRRMSFFVLSIFSLVIGILIYIIEPNNDGNYFDGLAILFSAYAIIVSFVLQRKLSDIRELGLELVNTVSSLRNFGIKKADAIVEIQARLNEPSRPKMKNDSEDRIGLAIDRIRSESATSFTSAEAIVLSLLTVTIVAIATGFRTPGFVSDLAAFATSVSAVFLTLFTIECSNFSFQWRVATNTISSSQENEGTDRESVILSIAGTAVVIFLVFILLIDKWVADILITNIR